MIKLENRFVKFLIVGIANNVVSYLSFLILNIILTYEVAYFISYGLGLISSYILNGKWTFPAKLGYLNFALYPLAYLLPFLSGYLALRTGIKEYHLDECLAYIISLFISIPIGFVTTKLYFRISNTEVVK